MIRNYELVDDLLTTTRVTRRDLEAHPEGVPQEALWRPDR
jgi:hypothetical protein